jgi:hypothetical protein
MTRRLYYYLVWIHPAAFRREFGPEMLWIYDQAAPEAGGTALCLDALLSLGRQWLLRSGLWKVVVALVGGLLQVGFASAVMAGIRRVQAPRILTGANPELAILMRLTVLITVGLLAAVMFLVFWWRMLSRRRGA